MIYHSLTFDGKIVTIEGLPYPLAGELKTKYPDFADVTLTTPQDDHILSFNDTKVSKPGFFAEPQFIEMFSVKMVQGSSNCLKEIHSIILSQTLADALVGTNAVGKMIKVDNRDLLMITGVFEDFPLNSQFGNVKMLMPLDYYVSLDKNVQERKTDWGSFQLTGFVLLDEKASFLGAASKIRNLCFQNSNDRVQSMKPEGVILPMKNWHLYDEFKDGKNVGGKIRYVWLFGTIGVFVLLLACINFMNLSTARSQKRSREIGVRKVMGSLRGQLVSQFLSESLLISFMAFILSIGVVILCLPWFNAISDKSLTIPWRSLYFVLLSVIFILTTGILAGSYPALYLSSFNPIKVLKGTLRAGRLAALPRKLMVIFQFTISTALIICTIVVFQQVQLAKRRPVGFDRKGIIYVPVRTTDLAKANYNSLRNDLLATGVVDNMAISDFPITGGMRANPTITWQGKDPASHPLIAMNSCSHDFPTTNGFVFKEGRDFSRDYASDSTALIINESAAKLISEKGGAIGKKLIWNQKEHEIIGVIKDQIRWSPFQKQSPHIYFIDYASNAFVSIRLSNRTSTRRALDKIESVFKLHDPGAPFDYKFVDDDYAKLFRDEERTNQLASVFAALAISISCIGIFGLASYASNQRTKEIGIRKVLGASVFTIWKMLSRDFVWLVTASVFLAAPLAYYFLRDWLNQYEYRIELSWWVFAAAAAGTLVITLLTVSHQSIRAAKTDPVVSLKFE
jgi:ABC-type antimicrobial peptide transport system permease subunit